MNKVKKYFAAGVLTSIGGLFYAELVGSLFNGSPYGTAEIVRDRNVFVYCACYLYGNYCLTSG